MPQPLPPNPYSHEQLDCHNAYNVCLHLETAAPLPQGPQDRRSELVFARFLGYMIIEAPSDEGRATISREINSCGDDATCMVLAEFLINHLLRFFRAHKGRTPTPSNHPSRPSFDETKDQIEWLLHEAPQDHTTAKQKALIRDEYRCVLTRRFDFNSVKTIPIIQQLNGAGAVAPTQLAHIFSKSTNKGISGNNEGGPKVSISPADAVSLIADGISQHKYAASAWAVLDRFGGHEFVQELDGDDINRLENVMTLSMEKHTYFDGLEIWFEATATPNTYNVRATYDFLLADINNPVVFRTDDPINLPTPSPRYLHLHAACAKVAHLSGAGEYIDSILRDAEKMKVLATDGSSLHLLNAVLSNQLAVEACFPPD